MHLPNREYIYVPKDKLSCYLLSETHEFGKSKARYFRAHGFNDGNLNLLEQRLTVKTIWIIETGDYRPRLVTAYPYQDMKTIQELDTVVLHRALPDFGLETGDIGTVVHCYDDGEGLKVEFVTGTGDTVGVATVERADIRPIKESEIMHVREITS